MEFNPKVSAERVVVIDGPVRPHPRRERVQDEQLLRTYGSASCLQPTLRETIMSRLTLLEEPHWRAHEWKSAPGGWLSTSNILLTEEQAQQLIEERCNALRIQPEQIETYETCPHSRYDEIFYSVPEEAHNSLFYLPLEERVGVLRRVIVPAVSAA
jgi:hypothetical protein